MATATHSNSKSKATSEAPWTDKAATAVHDTVDQMAHRAAQAEGNLRQTAENSSEALSAKSEAIKDQADVQYLKARAQFEKTRALAAQYPLATVGIAFSAGVLLTALLRGRR